MVKIAPSLLAADSACLGKAVSDLEASGADFIHFDVMDGHFVPNLTFGPKILQELKKHASLPFDVHLMVTNPDECISWYADAGADLITFHLETTQNPLQTIKLIKDRHIKSGITLKPSSNIEQIIPFIDDIDLVLVMGVQPGFGGQKFYPDTPERIKQTKDIIAHRSVLLEVDGGINFQNASLCVDAGADILVAGTAVFQNGTLSENIATLKGMLL